MKIILNYTDLLHNNVSAIEKYITLLCENIDTNDKSIHAFLPEKKRKKRLLKELNNLQEKLPSNLPLWGLTVGVKDVFFADDLPTRAGSRLPLKEFEGKQADIVTKLKNAGALILGKAVTTEFAYWESNGTVNPVNLEYSPGGSSSGPAAAVAAGLCDIGIGTQTVGSTLRPASYCGIVGFKCSYGRINPEGVVSFAPSLDTVGLLTKDIKTLNLVAKIVLKNWKDDEKLRSKPVLGIPVGKYLKQTNRDVMKIFDKTVELLQENGYSIKQIPLFENIMQINEDMWALASYEMATVHKNWYPKYEKLYRPKTKALIKKGLLIKKNAHQDTLEKQKKLQKIIENTMKKNNIDLWICPAASSYAPKLSDSNNVGNPLMNIPWTFAGLPSISVPIKNSGKMPFGLQLVTRYGEDETLLNSALTIERII
jgi:Asp-tRNA(Asn)/Glu-tRNA(Gln) amidotransferase A subunit family amidase